MLHWCGVFITGTLMVPITTTGIESTSTVCNHVTLHNQLLSLGVILSPWKHQGWNMKWLSPPFNDFLHNSSVSFSSTFHIKPLLEQKHFIKTLSRRKSTPLPSAQPSNITSILSHGRNGCLIFPTINETYSVFCCAAALWFDSRVPLLHLYAKHTDEAATYH